MLCLIGTEGGEKCKHRTLGKKDSFIISCLQHKTEVNDSAFMIIVTKKVFQSIYKFQSFVDYATTDRIIQF